MCRCRSARCVFFRQSGATEALFELSNQFRLQPVYLSSLRDEEQSFLHPYSGGVAIAQPPANFCNPSGMKHDGLVVKFSRGERPSSSKPSVNPFTDSAKNFLNPEGSQKLAGG